MTAHTDSELSEIHRTLAAPSPEFDAWVASMDKKLWARFDLSAARLGWEAAKAQGNPPMTAPADSRISDERLEQRLAHARHDAANQISNRYRREAQEEVDLLTELRERRAQEAAGVTEGRVALGRSLLAALQLLTRKHHASSWWNDHEVWELITEALKQHPQFVHKDLHDRIVAGDALAAQDRGE